MLNVKVKGGAGVAEVLDHKRRLQERIATLNVDFGMQQRSAYMRSEPRHLHMMMLSVWRSGDADRAVNIYI